MGRSFRRILRYRFLLFPIQPLLKIQKDFTTFQQKGRFTFLSIRPEACSNHHNARILFAFSKYNDFVLWRIYHCLFNLSQNCFITYQILSCYQQSVVLIHRKNVDNLFCDNAIYSFMWIDYIIDMAHLADFLPKFWDFFNIWYNICV